MLPRVGIAGAGYGVLAGYGVGAVLSRPFRGRATIARQTTCVPSPVEGGPRDGRPAAVESVARIMSSRRPEIVKG